MRSQLSFQPNISIVNQLMGVQPPNSSSASDQSISNLEPVANTDEISLSTSVSIEQGAKLSRHSLDRRLSRVKREVLKMGARVENSCMLARAALCDRNLDAAKQLPIQD